MFIGIYVHIMYDLADDITSKSNKINQFTISFMFSMYFP